MPRRRSSCGSGAAIRRGAAFTASTRRSTGNRRATASTSRGISASTSWRGNWARCRLSESIRLSSALYGTDSRS